MFLLLCKYLLEIASLRLASIIDLDAPGLLIVGRTVSSLWLLKEVMAFADSSLNKERTLSDKMCIQALEVAKPYSHPCKADIYFCIFYRWIQCRPRTPLATLRNHVKWMYMLVSEIHVMFQLNVLDPNRPEFVLCKKEIDSQGAGPLAD